MERNAFSRFSGFVREPTDDARISSSSSISSGWCFILFLLMTSLMYTFWKSPLR